MCHALRELQCARLEEAKIKNKFREMRSYYQTNGTHRYMHILVFLAFVMPLYRKDNGSTLDPAYELCRDLSERILFRLYSLIRQSLL